MRLLAMCASTMPVAASANQPHDTSAPRKIASNPASAAATNVIGSTPARVRYSHFETGSSRPGGGFVVASTYFQLPTTLCGSARRRRALGSMSTMR